jgi:predicted DnaQ family exonuclease/DinG family helicase
VESFVAIDLELTPFLGDQQRIIEIAAVRFRDGEVAESFSSLVNPHCSLDLRVSTLTGIRSDQIEDAPSFQSVSPGLIEFLGEDPLVGQSIHLDLHSLATNGIELHNPSIDTFELATLLIPGLPSYDLGTIARSLGIESEREHRALSDALTTGYVFLALQDRINRLSLDVLTQILALARQLTDWPLMELFHKAQRRRLKAHFVESGEVGTGSSTQDSGLSTQHSAPSAQHAGLNNKNLELIPPSSLSGQRTVLRPVPNPVPLDLDELSSLLRPGGPIAASLEGFEERQEQIRMMEAVAKALNEGGHLLVEAGTGTGKSLAYLLPAICYAVRNGRRAVISTNTVNLQDQLYHKDIPILQKCLPMQFRVALLKGRANYLCLRRWLVLSRSTNLTPSEILLLIKTLVWLSVTETGDKSELSLSATDSALWSRVSAQVESCALSRCPHYRRGTCFVTRARRAAEGAHIIVVNHALLLTDAAASGGILPEYSHLIVDEAHHLEAEATEQLGFKLSMADYSTYLATIQQSDDGQPPTGFIPNLLASLRASSVDSNELQALRDLISAVEGAISAAREDGATFFGTLQCFLHDQIEERSRNGLRLRITSSTRAQPGWSEVEVCWSVLHGRLSGLHAALIRLESAIQLLGDEQLLDREGILAELAGLVVVLARICSHGQEVISLPTSNGIYWIEGGAHLDELTIRSAPLHVGEALNNTLFSCKDTVILTSATLTTEGSFDYIKERLGLEEASELMLNSPFDYVRSTLLYIAQDIPEPTRPSCQRAVESVIANLAIAMEGRTLVLFTSHAQLRSTSSAIRSRLEEQGIILLAHGLDGSRRRLLQAFKSSPRAVLMGTSSFWEGIDVVGEALSCLVIVKLPFSVPTDPVFAARSEVFDEPFRQYSVPQTILRLKQGFGRLIRSSTDRGVVVMLDSRVGNKYYGPAFIHSLPQCTVQMGPAAHVVERAREWFR